VPRLEVPVRTYLRFTTQTVALPSSWYTPESVTIEFDGRDFGWLALKRFEHQHPDEPPPGPTVTTIVPEDTYEEWGDAREALQRFLSAIAFHYDVRVESRATSGGSGESNLLHPYGAIDASDAFAHQVVTAPQRVEVDADPRLRAALAVYREDLSAASPFYRFLAFWNVLETSFPNDEAKRDSFIRRVAPSSSYLSFPTLGDLAQHFRENSRNAIAHIVRSDPTDTSLDPDMPEDRERLDLEARWLQDVARKAVLQVWPDPVGLIRRG
jgi:hypothetical protein